MTKDVRSKRLALFGAVAAGALGLTILLGSAPAMARTSVGIGIGIPLYGPGYYAPAYPYPYYGSPYPPAYYAPPPAYAPPAYPAPAPAPGYYHPSADYGPPQDYGPPPDENCRETRSPATINGQQQWVYGTACQQPDGSWRNVD
jgi:hypothetical protein